MKKTRKESILKSRAERSETFGDQVFAWLTAPKTNKCTGGSSHARRKLAALGIIVKSDATFSEFYSWWKLRREFKEAVREATNIQELLKELDLGLTSYQIEAAGTLIFAKRALASGDVEQFRQMQYLRLAQRKDERESSRLQLDREKFETETCQLFIKWVADAKARKIAEATISNAEKIAALRKTFFADVDELEKSGSVILPRDDSALENSHRGGQAASHENVRRPPDSGPRQKPAFSAGVSIWTRELEVWKSPSGTNLSRSYSIRRLFSRKRRPAACPRQGERRPRTSSIEQLL